MKKNVISFVIYFLSSLSVIGQVREQSSFLEKLTIQPYLTFKKPINEPFTTMYDFGLGVGFNLLHNIFDSDFSVGLGGSYHHIKGVSKQEDILKVYFPNLNVVNYFISVRYDIEPKLFLQTELGGSSWMSSKRQDYYYLSPVLGYNFLNGFGVGLAIPVTFKYDRDPQRFVNIELRISKEFRGGK